MSIDSRKKAADNCQQPIEKAILFVLNYSKQKKIDCLVYLKMLNVTNNGHKFGSAFKMRCIYLWIFLKLIIGLERLARISCVHMLAYNRIFFVNIGNSGKRL